MSDERREILKMLREGILTVDEAERLLEALARGEKRRPPPEDPRGEQPPGARPSSVDLKARIQDIVDSAVRGALESGGSSRNRKVRGKRKRREAVPVAHGGFQVTEGATLIVRNPKKHPGGGSVLLTRAGDEQCSIQSEGPFTVHRDEGEFVVEWEYGDIQVEVPDAVAEVEAETWGGNVEVSELPVPLRIKSLGGDLRITDVCRSVQAMTAAGNVWLSVDALDTDSTSEVTTQAGDVFLDMGGEFSGVIKGSVLAGEVHVEEGLGRAFESSPNAGPRHVALEIGPDPRRAELTVRTLRGNLFVESRS